MDTINIQARESTREIEITMKVSHYGKVSHLFKEGVYIGTGISLNQYDEKLDHIVFISSRNIPKLISPIDFPAKAFHIMECDRCYLEEVEEIIPSGHRSNFLWLINRILDRPFWYSDEYKLKNNK